MESAPQPPPAGRRDNGLPSSDWGALVDVDPRLSEALLDSLGAAGVAAYVEPAAGSIDNVSRAVALPKRPLHRLWVDAARADQARSVVSAEVADLTALLAEEEPGATAHGFVQPVPRTAAARVLRPPTLPEPPAAARFPLGPQPLNAQPTSPQPTSPQPLAPPSGVLPPSAPPPVTPTTGSPPDAQPSVSASPTTPPGAPPSGPISPTSVPAANSDDVWNQIVAAWGRESEAPVPPWPVSEDVDDDTPTIADEAATSRRLRRRNDPEPDSDLPAWIEPDALEDDGHFVPPPPPPVPKVRRNTVGSLVALTVGLVLVFAPNLIGQVQSVGLGIVGIALMLGGAGALVWHMRDAPPTDSGPDDGAVV